MEVGLTSHCQNASILFLGGGSSYLSRHQQLDHGHDNLSTHVSASISAMSVMKSMSWALTIGFRLYSLAPVYNIGKPTSGM